MSSDTSYICPLAHCFLLSSLAPSVDPDGGWRTDHRQEMGLTHLDRICIGLCGICLGAAKVKADLGTSKLETRGLESYGGLFRMTA